MSLPLTYLKELEFLEQRLDIIFSITIRMVTSCIIKIESVSCFSLLNRQHSPRISFMVSGNKINWIKIEV